MKKLIWALLILLLVAGCVRHRMKLPEPPPPPPPAKDPALDYKDIKKQSLRERDQIPASMSRYEGSLWQDESSWGNLLRDHRARFRNDVITITGLQEIISVPAKEEPPKAPVQPLTPLAQQGEDQAEKLTQALEALNEASGEVDAEKEQNEVLRDLKTISARVVNVLQNGNMVIVGEKIDYRQQNSVRYVTKISGIIRPEDVTDKNEIDSLRLARSEVQIKRQVLAKSLKLKSLSPLIGQKKAGLLDRLSHIATPSKSRTSTRVNTR